MLLFSPLPFLFIPFFSSFLPSLDVTIYWQQGLFFPLLFLTPPFLLFLFLSVNASAFPLEFRTIYLLHILTLFFFSNYNCLSCPFFLISLRTISWLSVLPYFVWYAPSLPPLIFLPLEYALPVGLYLHRPSTFSSRIRIYL